MIDVLWLTFFFARRLYSLMLSDYRIDRWYTVFTEVLLKTLRSAFLSASVADFISCSIEAMSPNILIDAAERIVILENLWKVFQVCSNIYMNFGFFMFVGMSLTECCTNRTGTNSTRTKSQLGNGAGKLQVTDCHRLGQSV